MWYVFWGQVISKYYIHVSNNHIPTSHSLEINKNQPHSMLVLAPKMEMNFNISHSLILTHEIIDQINKRNLFLYVWGKIEYDDIFGQHHTTNFCAFKVDQTNNFGGCETNNNAN